MSSQELLLMLVMEVFQDKKSSNIIHKSILVSWVEVHGVLVLSIVPD